MAYNAVTGARLWTASYKGSSNGLNQAYSVAVSPDGRRVFVTGESDGSGTSLDYATVAYNAATGSQLWAARYHGPGTGEDAATAVAAGPTGSTVFVTGASNGASSGYDYATVAYDTHTGAQLWVDRYNGGAASSVAVSREGSKVYVTGGSHGAFTGSDYATLAYSTATGARLWLRRYTGPGDGSDSATSMAVSPTSNKLFVTGISPGWPGATAGGYATVAYRG